MTELKAKIEALKYPRKKGEYGDACIYNAAIDRVLALIPTHAAEPAPVAVEGDLQTRVLPWLIACFGDEVANDREERADRLVEELFELLQSGGYDPDRIIALRDYVWSRPVGEPTQEVGGTMLTLAAYCLAHGLDMHKAGEAELARVWGKVDVIRAKQAAKPKGSALPQAWPCTDLAPTGNTALVEFFDWIKLHKSSVLDRMTRREITEFTEAFGKAQLALSQPAAPQPTHEVEAMKQALTDAHINRFWPECTTFAAREILRAEWAEFNAIRATLARGSVAEK